MAVTAANPAKSRQNASLTPEELRHHEQELGFFGRVFGSKEHAPVYIAGLIAIISLVGACCVDIFSSDAQSKPDILRSLFGIVIAAISFIGGASGRTGT